jgi:ribokinase
MSRVVVFGGINVDESTFLDHIPLRGETIVGSSAPEPRVGGKGANQAIAARLLGSDVALVGAVGADDAGAWVLSRLRDNGVDVDRVCTLPAMTGRATIFITAEGDNAIVVNSGANAAMTTSDGLREVLTGADALLVQFELPLAAVARAVTAAVKRGLLTVTNAAPMVPAWSEELGIVLLGTRVLIVNEIEADQLAALAGIASPDSLLLARSLRNLGPDTVIITRGQDGLLAVDSVCEVAIDAMRVDVVDTTGAGDACCAAITVALLNGHDLAGAVELGNAAGAYSVGRGGAAESFGKMPQLEHMLTKTEARG